MRRAAVVPDAAWVATLIALVELAGCATPYLDWTPREPLAARRGRVAVHVDDARPGDPASLGRAYGWGGAPQEILVAPDHVRVRIERLSKEATVTAGLGLPRPGDIPTSRLHVSVDELRCDGTHMQAHAALAVRYAITAVDGTPRLPEATIRANTSGHSCERALDKALDALLDDLSAALVEGPAHDAAL